MSTPQRKCRRPGYFVKYATIHHRSATHALRIPLGIYKLRYLHYSTDIIFQALSLPPLLCSVLDSFFILTLYTTILRRLGHFATSYYCNTFHRLVDAYKFSLIHYDALPFTCTCTWFGLQVFPYTLDSLLATYVTEGVFPTLVCTHLQCRLSVLLGARLQERTPL